MQFGAYTIQLSIFLLGLFLILEHLTFPALNLRSKYDPFHILGFMLAFLPPCLPMYLACCHPDKDINDHLGIDKCLSGTTTEFKLVD